MEFNPKNHDKEGKAIEQRGENILMEQRKIFAVVGFDLNQKPQSQNISKLKHNKTAWNKPYEGKRFAPKGKAESKERDKDGHAITTLSNIYNSFVV